MEINRLKEIYRIINSIDYKYLFGALIAMEEVENDNEITEEYVNNLEELFYDFMSNDNISGIINAEEIREESEL